MHKNCKNKSNSAEILSKTVSVVNYIFFIGSRFIFLYLSVSLMCNKKSNKKSTVECARIKNFYVKYFLLHTLECCGHLNYMLNIFYVYYAITIKFAEITGLAILIVHIKNDYYSAKIELGIRTLSAAYCWLIKN